MFLITGIVIPSPCGRPGWCWRLTEWWRERRHLHVSFECWHFLTLEVAPRQAGRKDQYLPKWICPVPHFSFIVRICNTLSVNMKYKYSFANELSLFKKNVFTVNSYISVWDISNGQILTVILWYYRILPSGTKYPSMLYCRLYFEILSLGFISLFHLRRRTQKSIWNWH